MDILQSTPAERLIFDLNEYVDGLAESRKLDQGSVLCCIFVGDNVFVGSDLGFVYRVPCLPQEPPAQVQKFGAAVSCVVKIGADRLAWGVGDELILTDSTARTILSRTRAPMDTPLPVPSEIIAISSVPSEGPIAAASNRPAKTKSKAKKGAEKVETKAAVPSEPNALLLALGTGRLCLVDLQGPSVVASFTAHDGPVYGLQCMHSVEKKAVAERPLVPVVTCGDDSKAVLWDLDLNNRTLSQVSVFTFDQTSEHGSQTTRPPHATQFASCLDISPNGEWLVCGGSFPATLVHITSGTIATQLLTEGLPRVVQFIRSSGSDADRDQTSGDILVADSKGLVCRFRINGSKSHCLRTASASLYGLARQCIAAATDSGEERVQQQRQTTDGSSSTELLAVCGRGTKVEIFNVGLGFRQQCVDVRQIMESL
eukprot:Clim_evm2s85 gene=Clim_evmTU2s85